MLQSPVDIVAKHWPGRERQVAALHAWLSERVGSHMIVHGPSGTGKTGVVRHCLEAWGRCFAYMPLPQEYKLRQLLNALLSQLWGHAGVKRKRDAGFGATAGADSWNEFAEAIADVCPPSSARVSALVLDNMEWGAHRNLLPQLLAAIRCHRASVVVITITSTVPQDVRFGSGLGVPLPLMRCLHFPAYDRDQLVAALAADVPTACGAAAATAASGGLRSPRGGGSAAAAAARGPPLADLYGSFLLAYVVTPFSPLTRSAADLAAVASWLWPLYSRPLAEGQVRLDAPPELQVRQLDGPMKRCDVVRRLLEQYRPGMRTPPPGLLAAAAAAAREGGAAAAARGPGGGGGGGEGGAVVRLHSSLIAVLTHLVGKLRSVALEDPNICGVVFPLLKFSTRVGSPESEVLVDEAFRLWSVTLASLPSVPPPLRELLPNAAALLRRGRDAAALLPLLEAYLLLDAADSLQPLAADMGRALEASISSTASAVLTAVGTSPSAAAAPPPGAPAPMGAAAAATTAVPLSPETPAEALAAAALIDVLLQLFPPPQPPPSVAAAAPPPSGAVGAHGPAVALVAPALRAMAALLAHPGVPSAGLNVKIINIFEGFLEVLGRLWLLAPATFPELTAGLDGGGGGGVDAVERLLDRWLTIASARFLEEVVGVKTMSMLGRFRRRMATMSLTSLLLAGACDRLFEPRKLLRLCALAVQALADDSEFGADQSELDGLDFAADLAADTVLARRLAITRSDPVRKVDVHDCVRGLLARVSERAGGPEALLSGLAAHGAGERLRSQLAAVLAGGRIRAGGGLEGAEGDGDDSCDAADEEELLGMVPALSEGGLPFASSGSTPD